MDLTAALKGAHAYLSPDAILAGLPADVAHRRPPEAPHSIAETVAHLAFWQSWFLDRCEGRATPPPTRAAHGWPDVSRTAWDSVHDTFLAGYSRALAIAADRDRWEVPLSPAIEFEMLSHYAVGDVVQHIALHNAHHLGQVILLRQQLAAWPPPAGSYTW